LRQRDHRPFSVTREIHLGVLETRQCLAEENFETASLRLTNLVLTLPSLEYRSSFTSEGPEFLAFMRRAADGASTSELVRRRLLTLLDTGAAEATPAQKPILEGAGDLTAREQSILRLVTAGYGNKEIGRRLDLSDNTVKFHLRNVFQKLQVHSRTAAISAARELGITV
jgi:LuxR family maltose regulon positive regulatory protein